MRIHILPDGCTDFIFYAWRSRRYSGGRKLDYATLSFVLCGADDEIFELITYSESVHMFGVRFLPCGLSCFTKLPLHEFVNDRISTREMKAVFDDTFC